MGFRELPVSERLDRNPLVRPESRRRFRPVRGIADRPRTTTTQRIGARLVLFAGVLLSGGLPRLVAESGRHLARREARRQLIEPDRDEVVVEVQVLAERSSDNVFRVSSHVGPRDCDRRLGRSHKNLSQSRPASSPLNKEIG